MATAVSTTDVDTTLSSPQNIKVDTAHAQGEQGPDITNTAEGDD